MEQKNKICIKARLVGQSTDGSYKNYVFQDMGTLEYIMCTRLPNWNVDDVKIAEAGFLEYQTVIGGQDTYFSSIDQITKRYLQDATYFLNFVPITKVLKDGYVVDSDKLVLD